MSLITISICRLYLPISPHLGTTKLFHKFLSVGVYRRITSPFPSPVNKNEFCRMQTYLTSPSVTKTWKLWCVHNEMIKLCTRLAQCFKPLHGLKSWFNPFGPLLLTGRSLDDRKIVRTKKLGGKKVYMPYPWSFESSTSSLYSETCLKRTPTWPSLLSA